MKSVYVVTAYRFADRSLHSYLVGVFQKKAKALYWAELEAGFRGGKYECEVLECNLDTAIEHGEQFKKILELGPSKNPRKYLPLTPED